MDLRAQTVAAVDTDFAESVRLVFMVPSQYGGPSEDASRPASTIRAVLRAQRVRDLRLGEGIGWTARVSGEGTELHIDRAAYPELDVRQGDRVQALDRPGAS